MYFKRAVYALLILLFAGVQHKLYAQSGDYIRKVKLNVQKVNPPVFNFYAKVLYSDSIAIRSAAVVDNNALVLAGMKIRAMLRFMPAVRHNLIQQGAEMHIIATEQKTSDLPEYLGLKGKPYKDNRGITYKSVDERARGFGSMYACCPEENLLEGTYYDICVHEFAHVVMNFGLDNVLKKKINVRYKIALTKGLWKGDYAATDALEYWAEISSRYFGANAKPIGKVSFDQETLSSEALREYDEEGYNLVDSIYSGLLQPATIQMLSAKKAQADTVVQADYRPVEFTVTNNTAKKIKVFLNYHGSYILKGTISPYNHWIISATRQQIWRITDEQGHNCGYYWSNTPNCRAIITQ